MGIKGVGRGTEEGETGKGRGRGTGIKGSGKGTEEGEQGRDVEGEQD